MVVVVLQTIPRPGKVTQTQMVANLNALSFESAASSMDKNMPVGIPMASARVPEVELFDVVGY